ncbi:MAG TPA: bifunctional glutamate N-acetyltransferase/amino-acid acetyltransferase ArgJ [Candidatus Scubalenecus merdavium]|uniref:Arginine biosynthesis bifunctional protein ArgJ n=1 Tax=Candidatus Scybalenecus merdavium TaxID=2840939 RepID=A0A9D1SNB0_9FIRM|nr:bifunctional glutamate N-acetyltransferase/amino-acid acetyltransferase ArgJ [Candidatus Scubalenecus merdavium]
MEVINGGVTAAKGFKANGLYCGIKKPAVDDPSIKHKNDIGLLVCDVPCATAAVYTQNKVKGAPILVTKKNLEATGGMAKAVIVNSKNANTCNADGEEKAEKMCRLAAGALGIRPEEVVVASTGVIGQVLPIEPIENCIDELAAGVDESKNEAFATAIMTTDTVKKEYAVQFEAGGVRCTVGGCAKGSGMIHPNMATTLNFITTDTAISPALLQKALSEIVKVTYNCLTIDGDTSTNDMVALLSSGLAGNKTIETEDAAYAAFKAALYEVMMHLTRMLAKDGEGATKLIEVTCSGAPDLDTAITVAKEITGSTLLKCAIFGKDANWGRILCAIGYAPAEFDIEKVSVSLQSEFGCVTVCENGSGVAFSEEEAAKVLQSDEIEILTDLHQGTASAKAWGCDLTYDYVKINGDYRT